MDDSAISSAHSKLQRLLEQFQELYAKPGSQYIDVRWHYNALNCANFFPLDDGGCDNIEWRGAKASDPPFQIDRRQVVAQLCLPFGDSGERHTLGFDCVTLPRTEHLAPLVAEFRRLAAEAGAALPSVVRQQLTGYYRVLNPSPALWWYALLYQMLGLSVQRPDGTFANQLFVPDAILVSIDVMQSLLKHLQRDATAKQPASTRRKTRPKDAAEKEARAKAKRERHKNQDALLRRWEAGDFGTVDKFTEELIEEKLIEEKLTTATLNADAREPQPPLTPEVVRKAIEAARKRRSRKHGSRRTDI